MVKETYVLKKTLKEIRTDEQTTRLMRIKSIDKPTETNRTNAGNMPYKKTPERSNTTK